MSEPISSPRFMSRAELRRYEWLNAEKEKRKKEKQSPDIETLVTAANRGPLWTERKTMKESELRTLVRFIIREVHNAIDETSSTASAGGQVDIPKAFEPKKTKKFIPDTTFEPYAKPKKKLQEIRSIIRRTILEAKLKPGQSYSPDLDATYRRAVTHPHELPIKIDRITGEAVPNKNVVRSQPALHKWRKRQGHKPGEQFVVRTGQQETEPIPEKAAKKSKRYLTQREQEARIAVKAHNADMRRKQRAANKAAQGEKQAQTVAAVKQRMANPIEQ